MKPGATWRMGMAESLIFIATVAVLVALAALAQRAGTILVDRGGGPSIVSGPSIPVANISRTARNRRKRPWFMTATDGPKLTQE